MNILIADSFPLSHQQALSEAGHVVTFDASLEGETLAAALGDHEILVVRSTKVNADAIDAAAALKLVIRAGAGTNTIDKAHAAAKQIRVCNVPGANAMAVAELVIGLMIAIDRNLANNITDLRNQRWNKKGYSKAFGLHGKSLGILGLGAIGIHVAARAAAFGMNIYTLARSNWSAQSQQGIAAHAIVQIDSMEELLGKCDVISLHLPLTPDTENIVDKKFLAAMKDHAILINSARGDLIDEAALIEAMDSKGIRAGLDVYQNEPSSGEGEFASPLANHHGVCGTHHIGASTEQAQTAVADGVLRVINSFEKGTLLHCVNEQSIS